MAILNGVADLEEAFQPCLKGPLETAGGCFASGVFLPALPQVFFQRNAVDQLHGQMQTVLAIRVQAEDRNDGRVIQLGIEFRLGNEFFDAPGTGQMFFFQGFYDDIASQHEVFRQKDSSESALGDHLSDLVALPAFLQSAAEFQRGIRIQIDGLNRFM